MPTLLTLTPNAKPCYRKAKSRLDIYHITTAGQLPSSPIRKGIRFQKYTRKCYRKYRLSTPPALPTCWTTVSSRLANLRWLKKEACQWQMTTHARAWASDHSSLALKGHNIKIHPSQTLKAEGEKEKRWECEHPPGTRILGEQFPFIYLLTCLQGRERS